jgi:outer membrane protein OmpA-like peptidoglycan-associated protein
MERLQVLSRPATSKLGVSAPRRLFVAAAMLVSIATPSRDACGQAARLNLTGAWDGSFMGGANVNLFQEGDNVWGKYSSGNGDGFARGNWRDGRLILTLTPTTAKLGSACEQRKFLVIPATATAMRLQPYVLDLANNAKYTPAMKRTSPSPGPAVEYPYEAELKNCGQLFTYELVFGTNSDTLSGTDWPVLAVLADLLKKDPALKIEIAGHTDATGDAKANQGLSERRANTVVRILTEKYGIDPKRLTAKGYGSEQPIAENDTEQGRAINRRVEIVKQ